MASNFRVSTNDLTVHFFEKSFTVKGNCIYTGRKVNREDGAGIAKILQSLVDYGVHKKTGKFPTLSDTFTIADEHLVSENEQYRDTIQDLENEILDLKQSLDWWTQESISEEDQRDV
jgi:glycine cleavage system protein P-like pyridoxal-binding family